jgi:3'-phosphoadenosine 5'-phosphosulfate sulfotransferase (PAPS reductase)/FAD synthetase
MNLKIPSWMRIDRQHYEVTEPTIVSTSGGLTSAVMAALFHHCDSPVEYCFWNTGREAKGTYQFLGRLAECIPLRFFEVRKPRIVGDRPSAMGYEEVSFDRLDQTGEPFRVFLETLKEYRAIVKNKPPIGPNPVQRLCTSYMKIKLADHIAAHLWGRETAWTSAVGLRADEPSRVARITARDTALKTNAAPLAKSGITKAMVEAFWQEQSFTLQIPPHQGNCTLCFLKDESDLADILTNEPDPDGNDWEWWKDLDERFSVRGRGAVSYRQIQAEAPMRFAIRESLVQIKPLPRSADYDPRRFKLIRRQEEKIIREGHRRVPCSCESAELMTDNFILEAQGSLFLAAEDV